jgi:hypothetical protein
MQQSNEPARQHYHIIIIMLQYDNNNDNNNNMNSPSSCRIAIVAPQIAEDGASITLAANRLVLPNRNIRKTRLPCLTKSRIRQRWIVRLVFEVSFVLDVDVNYIDRLQVDLLGSIRSSVAHQLEKPLHPGVAHLVLGGVRKQHSSSLLNTELNVEFLGHVLQLVDVYVT